MKLEKRSEGGTEPTPPLEEHGGKKPVIIYIMILFVVAFLLMALSFLMHQRSNSETLTELRNSVTAVEAAQKNQEEILALQEELSAANASVDDLETQVAEQEARAAELEEQYQALQTEYDGLDDRANSLEYTLEQTRTALEYFARLSVASAQNQMEECRSLIAVLEDTADGQTPLKDYLPDESATGDAELAPARQYAAICAAVSEADAEDGTAG